jgi:hypothetical protein
MIHSGSEISDDEMTDTIMRIFLRGVRKES